jgi:hypothetical protein
MFHLRAVSQVGLNSNQQIAIVSSTRLEKAAAATRAITILRLDPTSLLLP